VQLGPDFVYYKVCTESWESTSADMLCSQGHMDFPEDGYSDDTVPDAVSDDELGVEEEMMQQAIAMSLQARPQAPLCAILVGCRTGNTARSRTGVSGAQYGQPGAAAVAPGAASAPAPAAGTATHSAAAPTVDPAALASFLAGAVPPPAQQAAQAGLGLTPAALAAALAAVSQGGAQPSAMAMQAQAQTAADAWGAARQARPAARAPDAVSAAPQPGARCRWCVPQAAAILNF